MKPQSCLDPAGGAGVIIGSPVVGAVKEVVYGGKDVYVGVFAYLNIFIDIEIPDHDAVIMGQ